MGEGEIRRREYRRLGVLNIEVFHLRQVAHTASDPHVAFVFDGPGLGTMAHAQIAVLGIGPEGDADNVHILAGGDTAQLRELNVVADHDGDTAGVGIEDLELITTFNNPVAAFVGGDVHLALLVHTAIPMAQVRNVVDPVVFNQRHGAGDNVDVVTDGHFRHFVAELFG